MRVVGVYTCCPGCGLVLCSLIVVSLLGGFFPALVVGMFPVLWCFLVFMLWFPCWSLWPLPRMWAGFAVLSGVSG